MKPKRSAFPLRRYLLNVGARVVCVAQRGTGLGLCGQRGSRRLAVQVVCAVEYGRFFGREVGDTKVKENRAVSSLVTRCETKVSVVKHVAAMCSVDAWA